MYSTIGPEQKIGTKVLLYNYIGDHTTQDRRWYMYSTLLVGPRIDSYYRIVFCRSWFMSVMQVRVLVELSLLK